MSSILRFKCLVATVFVVCMGMSQALAGPQKSKHPQPFNGAQCLASCTKMAKKCVAAKKAGRQATCKKYLTKCTVGCQARARAACFKSCELSLKVCKKKSGARAQFLEKCTQDGARCLSSCAKARK